MAMKIYFILSFKNTNCLGQNNSTNIRFLIDFTCNYRSRAWMKQSESTMYESIKQSSRIVLWCPTDQMYFWLVWIIYTGKDENNWYTDSSSQSMSREIPKRIRLHFTKLREITIVLYVTDRDEVLFCFAPTFVRFLMRERMILF